MKKPDYFIFGLLGALSIFFDFNNAILLLILIILYITFKYKNIGKVTIGVLSFILGYVVSILAHLYLFPIFIEDAEPVKYLVA